MLLGTRPSRVTNISKLSARASAPLALVSLLLLHHVSPLVVVPNCDPATSSALHTKVLSNLEKMVVGQKTQEMTA